MSRSIAVPLSCSVVVPVKDDAEELGGLLKALGRQTEPPLEIIVVDNGSSDDSARIAAGAGCRVLHEPVAGIPAAVAAGYDAAVGDLILRCDADSRPRPTWVAAHRRAHATAAQATGGTSVCTRPRVVAVTGPARFRLPAPLDLVTSAMYLGGYVLAVGSALGHPPLFGTTMSLRREWWQDVRDSVSRSADVHDDMDLSFSVLPHQTVRVTWDVAVDMSPRALRWGRPADVRARRAFVTLARAWQRQAPWDRWADRLTHRGLDPRRLGRRRQETEHRTSTRKTEARRAPHTSSQRPQ